MSSEKVEFDTMLKLKYAKLTANRLWTENLDPEPYGFSLSVIVEKLRNRIMTKYGLLMI